MDVRDINTKGYKEIVDILRSVNEKNHPSIMWLQSLCCETADYLETLLYVYENAYLAYRALGTVEKLTALVEAKKEGRVVVLPKEPIAARFEVADMLEDDLKESSFSDPSVGVYGLTWAQSELWQAIIDGLNAGDTEAEAALPGGDRDG